MTDISESGIEAALLPCPFCNHRAMGPYAGTSLWWISCTHCEATQSHGTSAGVVDLWNRRHPPDSREEGLNEDDWQALLSAVENLRGGGNQDEPTATDTRWRIASNLADIAERLRAALQSKKPE